MWGNFMEKAKGLAENLDKQINESVGLDDPVLSKSTSDAPSATTSVSISGSAATSAGASFHENNFATPNGKNETNQSFSKTESEAQVHGDVVGNASEDLDVDADAWKDDDFDFDGEDEGMNQDDERQEQEYDADDATGVPVVPSNVISTTKIGEETVAASRSELFPMEAVKNDKEETIVNDGTTPDTESEQDEAFQSKVQEEIVANSSEFKSIAKDRSQESNSNLASSEDEELAAFADASDKNDQMTTSEDVIDQESTQSTKQDVSIKNDETMPRKTESVENPAAFGSVFSSFAHKAEALAHQAESLVNIPHPEEEKPSMSSLFSSVMTTVGQPSANNDVKDSQISKLDVSESESGWEAEENDGLQFDESENALDKNELESPTAVIEREKEGGEQHQEQKVESPFENKETASTIKQGAQLVEEKENQDSAFPRSKNEEAVQTQDVSNRALDSDDNFNSSAKMPVHNLEDDPRYQKLLRDLHLREEQLSNKSSQLTELQDMMEQQERDWKKKLTETKEEAKKRILRAKERWEASEKKFQQLKSSQNADSTNQSQLVQALREEGAALAHKQSALEQVVRATRVENRELQGQLESVEFAKAKALEKINYLETELKKTKESLVAARKGESRAEKLDQELLSARSESEQKAATIFSLQQEVKELNEEQKELKDLLARGRTEALKEAQQEKKSLRKEHNDVISDLETKLRTTEREAGVREDALRHEVSELRKRWQDAVRRADALSMDVQSSTAPLLRQLESMERQNRVRAANWAELEEQLRSELEETVIQKEQLSKDRSDYKTKYTRLERTLQENEEQVRKSQRLLEDQSVKISKLEKEVEKLEAKAEIREEEYSKVERLANEGVMRVRSEMSQTVIESEERYRGQIEKLEGQLRIEHEKKKQLESQVEDLLENAGMIIAAPQSTETRRRDAKPKKLRQAEGQAEILAGALGFDSDTDDDNDDGGFGHPMERGGSSVSSGGSRNGNQTNGGMSSFAALDQLTSRLKATTSELESLRRNLRESESIRESLVAELGESRSAKEKLPLFETKIKELSEENREKELEIAGLREDIADVREMYRTQLNVLLEEKAAQFTEKTSKQEHNDTSLPEDTAKSVPTTPIDEHQAMISSDE